jgi:hypothetical protein
MTCYYGLDLESENRYVVIILELVFEDFCKFIDILFPVKGTVAYGR